ncbi:MAG TPA: alpha/beta hydrolase [Tepidisphaeraceae bacterium]
MISRLTCVIFAILPGFAATTKPTLPPPPPGVRIVQDVTYLQPTRHEKLDLYLPATQTAPSPAVAIIHGGGWIAGDKASSREFNIGTTLATHGYVAASINYKLGKQLFPQNLFDCKNAVRFLRAGAKEYQIDPGKIAVIGGSAGGHLALMVAYTAGEPALEPSDGLYPNIASDVRCVIDMYGVTDLFTIRKNDEQGKPAGPSKLPFNVVTGTATDSRQLWEQASPVFHITPKTPPTLILQGDADTTVNFEQSTELAEKLKAADVPHELIMLQHIGHTFDLEKWNRKKLPRDLRPILLEFLEKHLKDR